MTFNVGFVTTWEHGGGEARHLGYQIPAHEGFGVLPGVPIDRELYALGMDFTDAIDENDFDRAEGIIECIENELEAKHVPQR